jgi:Ca2+-binding RTX toxin-like protein
MDQSDAMSRASRGSCPESANVEKLTPAGTANLNATGNTLHNVLKGNAGANAINGGLDADTMIGSGGNDGYIVDNAGDISSFNFCGRNSSGTAVEGAHAVGYVAILLNLSLLSSALGR